MEKRGFQRGLPVKSLLAMLIFTLLALPRTSLAVPILKLEFKALPEVFISGTTLDLPLYLVENRDESESSGFARYPATPPFTIEGPFTLAEFDSGFKDVYVADQEIIFCLRSTDGSSSYKILAPPKPLGNFNADKDRVRQVRRT